MKLTIARYYTPSGRSIQAKGIEPDIFLKFRRLAPEELTVDESLLKEKDLENHLEAEPGAEGDTEDESEDAPNEKERRMREMDLRVGPLRLEVLQSDNQVMRALEILVGYDIFQSLKR